MKQISLVLALVVGILLFCLLQPKKDGFKNIDFDAQNQLEKITTKILPGKAICIRGAQCISGKCLENNNETTFGYCAEPIA
jgi:hypothetical protein